MWILRCLNNSLFYLWEKQTYTVGRKNTDIIISNDDSISRTHAIVEIENNNIYLTDKGSKYGTFIGGSKLNANEKRRIYENDEIKFGLLQNPQSTFKLEKLKIKVVTSNVKSNDKKELNNSLDFLNATRSNSWDKSCTHIVVSEVILTAKVLCALTEEQPIVNVKYFLDYVSTVKNNLCPPSTKDYLPEINETLLSKNIKLEYSSTRRTLFKDKIFVFLTEKCKKQMADLITVTGGKAVSWEKEKSDITKLKINSPNYLFIEENLEDINQTTEIYKLFTKCTKQLSETSKRPIPLQEIALAIVHNSIAENCNPLFNRAALLIIQNTENSQKSENILVYDTQHSSTAATSTQKSPQDSQNIPTEVPPSFDTDISIIPHDSSANKRPLEVDNSAEKITKKSREDQPQFSFRRSSTASLSTNVSKNSVFCFPGSSNSTTNNDKDNDSKLENPFSRKRKATKELETVAKKTPLENISNRKIDKPSVDTPAKKPPQNSSNSFKENTSTIIKCPTWFTNVTIKSEICDDDTERLNEIKLEPEDEKVTKLNELFRDSITVKYIPLHVSQKQIVANSGDTRNRKNFKLFKKAPNSTIQTIILTNDQLVKFVVGDEDKYLSDDDDVQAVEDEEMIYVSSERPQPQQQQKPRRKFQFCV